MSFSKEDIQSALARLKEELESKEFKEVLDQKDSKVDLTSQD